MKTTAQDIRELFESLANRFYERKALRCLLRFLPACSSINGLTDGWEVCRAGLADTRALCCDESKPDEKEDLHKAMNCIDRMLSGRQSRQ